jgi:hypothetical protein
MFAGRKKDRKRQRESRPGDRIVTGGVLTLIAREMS